MTTPNNKIFTSNVDWSAILIYLALIVMGWVNIYAAVYDDTAAGVFDMGQRYGMQLIWMGISLVAGITIMLIDDKYYHMFAYFFYAVALLILLGVLLGGKEVNGARAWIDLGTVRIQPAEFVKFATALAVARYMSRYSFSIHSVRNIIGLGVILGLPMIIIILQNDTGSAIVYGAFILMMYREGLSGWVYVIMLLTVALFVFSFWFSPFVLIIILLACCIVGQTLFDGRVKNQFLYALSLAGVTAGIYYIAKYAFHAEIEPYLVLLAVCLVSIVPVVRYAYRKRLSTIYLFVTLFIGALIFIGSVDFVFDNFMQIHQQKRILDLLGVESDLTHWGYNVNQSKIAIGSGGLFGKGFLEGTQTKFNFVPEQSTDFIFCTVGEEWGFAGSLTVVVLFCLLILRLIKMGERQPEAFGRIYCYSVAAIFFVHVFINIGMTIGIMPVIGIPLPFFSYGGSSFLAFSLLFFVALRMDSSSREAAGRYN